MAYCNKPVAYVNLVGAYTACRVDMKNENKTTNILILIFPGKNTLWNHRKYLKNGSAKHFVSLRKFNHICWNVWSHFPFLLVMWTCTTKQECLHIKNWKKHLEARLHCIRALNPRPEENLQLYKKLAKKRFLKSKFWISHLILNLIPKISCLQNSFDNNEGLLCSQNYREGKRPGNIELSTGRQFVISKENKKNMNLLMEGDRSFSLHL